MAPNTYTRWSRARKAASRSLAGLAVAWASLYSTYVYAQQGDSAVLLGGAGEYYLAALPAGWSKRSEIADDMGRHGDWLPEGQSLARWRDRITLQVVPEMVGRTARTFLDQMADLRAQTCDGIFATEVESANLNGFPVGFRIIACTRDTRTGTGSIALLRAVAGEQALYVVQRVFQVAPFSPGNFPVSGEELDMGRAEIEYGLPCRRGHRQRPCPVEWRPVLDGLPAERSLAVFPVTP